jgi:hypothetical protein
MACLYLGGKVSDTPKSCSMVISACVEGLLVGDRPQAQRRMEDRAWVAEAREAVFTAERALLYQLGFRFTQVTVQEALIKLLQGEDVDLAAPRELSNPPLPALPLRAFLDATLGRVDSSPHARFVQLCYHFARQAIKTRLCLQYQPRAVAAACIWFVMKLLRVDTAPLRAANGGKPWYTLFGTAPSDLESESALEEQPLLSLSRSAAGDGMRRANGVWDRD